MIARLFRRGDERRRTIEALHLRINAASREPGLYTALGVPDTVEGRFESLVLHTVLVLRRLKALPAPAPDVAQDLVNSVFLQLDASLRELGVGDMGVSKRMKKLGSAVYGRAESYAAALDSDDDARLASALARNVVATEGATAGVALAGYVAAAARRLDGFGLDAILREGPPFPRPEAFAMSGAAA